MSTLRRVRTGQLHVSVGHTCGTGILPVRRCGIGILPMIHGLEGDPQREIMRWGPQAHATSTPRPPALALRVKNAGAGVPVLVSSP